jgi:predicted Ser/Thr protein kinase
MDKDTITSIFEFHQNGIVNSIEKVEIGFSNEVYSINDNFILKVCKDTQNEKRFEIESFFYQLFKGKLPTPEIKVYDKSKRLCDYNFMIYPKIQGLNLYSKWHLLNTDERKNIIREICDVLRIDN